MGFSEALNALSPARHGDILVVGGSSTHASDVGRTLRTASYSVRQVASGRAAIAEASARMPDLVVLDVELPDLDGYEVCRRIKRLDDAKHVPVIFVSAFGSTTAKLTAFAAGGIDYLTKPVGTEEFLARVDVQLRVARGQREMEVNNRELETVNRLLRSLSFVDGLTGVGNRRHFEETIGIEWRRCMRGDLPLALVMLDIDHFKDLNDSFGHPVGDDCLRRVAGALRAALRRPGDTIARYGGEEFAVVLPATTLDGAVGVGEIARQAVENLGIASPLAPGGVLTVSAGVASTLPDGRRSPRALVTAADEALYAAKSLGRNRVTPADGSSSSD